MEFKSQDKKPFANVSWRTPSLIQSFAYFDQRWGLAIIISSIVPCMDSKENKAKIQYNGKKNKNKRMVETKGRVDSS